MTTSLLLAISGSLLAQPSVGIQLKQGKTVYNLLEVDSVVIKAKSFKYIVTFPSNSQINLHHSYSDSLYKVFKAKKINRIKDWHAHCMAEESYNSDKEILISADGWSCWFYDENINFHRLDAKSIRTQRATVRGTKTVNSLNNVDSREKIDTRQASKPIYLIIAAPSHIKDSIQYSHTCKFVFE